MATISLCILAQVFVLLCGLLHSLLEHFLTSSGYMPYFQKAYSHAGSIIQSLGEEDINEKFLIQLDKFVRLLEAPTFLYLRFQVGTFGCFK